MIADLKPYPAMEDSGVEWLGEVPAYWEIRRLKQVCRLAYGDALAAEVRKDGVVPVLGSNGRVGFHNAANTKAPCIVIGRKGSFGKVNYSERPVFAIDTTFFVDNRFSSAHIRWLFFLFGWLRLDEVTRDSAVPGLDREDAYQKLIVAPPFSEQAAIVRFLDYADRRIQRYIRAKQKLVTLLEEQKQAIIHQAVTGQIDVRTGQPYPAYKPSGVEWLGDVPEHWEVRRMKHLVTTSAVGIQMGPFGASLTQLQHQDTGYKVYGQENTISGDFQKGSRWITEGQFKELHRYELVPGDLVLTRKGSIGKCRLIPDGIARGIADSDTIRLRLDGQVVLRQFVVMLLHQASYLQWQIESVRRGAVLGGLNTSTIATLCVVVPPIQEQQKLVETIASEAGILATASDAAERQIQHLTQYRTRLIADVVTGKLDVREAAARLPDEVEAPKPLEETDALTDTDNREAAPEEAAV